MTAPGPSPLAVGRQLYDRREDLDLTQDELAQRIGISPRTVSSVERGSNQITKSRRNDWETALGLKSGTIGRAYRLGTPIELAGHPPETLPATLPNDTPRDASERAAMLREVRDRLDRNAREQEDLQRRLFRLIGEENGDGDRETG